MADSPILSHDTRRGGLFCVFETMNQEFDSLTDDDEPYPTVEVVEILPTMQEQVDTLMDRYRELGREAETLGIITVAILGTNDPLTRECYFNYCFFGSHYEARGLVEMMRDRL
jgi:hypothetical protein